MAARRERSVLCNEQIIGLVRERPAIFDTSNAAYKDCSQQDAAWREVACICFQNWESLSATEQSKNMKYLQRRWRILKDGYQRFLLQQRKATRGSGAKRTPLYAHGRELEFLRPVLEWRETQASWEDSPLDSEEEEEEEEEEYLEEHASQEEPLGESGSTARAAAPMGEEEDEPGPSCAYAPARRAARGSSGSAKLIEELLKVVEKLSQKMDESQDEDVAFTNLITSIARKVPPERKHAMRMALLSIAQSFVDGTYPCYQPPLH